MSYSFVIDGGFDEAPLAARVINIAVATYPMLRTSTRQLAGVIQERARMNEAIQDSEQLLVAAQDIIGSRMSAEDLQTIAERTEHIIDVVRGRVADIEVKDLLEESGIYESIRNKRGFLNRSIIRPYAYVLAVQEHVRKQGNNDNPSEEVTALQELPAAIFITQYIEPRLATYPARNGILDTLVQWMRSMIPSSWLSQGDMSSATSGIVSSGAFVPEQSLVYDLWLQLETAWEWVKGKLPGANISRSPQGTNSTNTEPVKFWPVIFGDQLELRSFEIQGNRLIAKGAITYVYPHKPGQYGVKETPIRIMIALTTEEAEEFARNPAKAQGEILRRYKAAEDYVIGWHGYLETGEQFEPAADQVLAPWDEQGKKQVMIALSHSGTEETYLETKGYTAENLIKQVEDAVEYLVIQNDVLQKPKAKVTVMGHSLGGGVTLRLAEKHAGDTTGIWANIHYVVLTPYIGDQEQLTLLNDFQIIPGYPKTGILRVMNLPVMRYLPFVRAYIVWASHTLGIGDALFNSLMSVDEIRDSAVLQSKAIALDTLDHAKVAIRMTQSLLTLKPVSDMTKISALSNAERLIIVSPNADDTLNTYSTDKMVILHNIHRVAYARGHNPMIKDMAGVVRQVVQHFFSGTPVEYPIPGYLQESAKTEHSFWGIVWIQLVQKARGLLGITRVATVVPQQTAAIPAHFDPTFKEPAHYEDWEKSDNSSSILLVPGLGQWFSVGNVSRDGIYRLVVIIPDPPSGGVAGMSINGFPVAGTVGIHLGDIIEVENGPTYRVTILGNDIGLADVALEQLDGDREVTRTNANPESDHEGKFPEGNWYNTPRHNAVIQISDGEQIIETIQPWLDAQNIETPATEFIIRFPDQSVMLRDMYVLRDNVNSFYKLFDDDIRYDLVDARTGAVIGMAAVHGRFLAIEMHETAITRPTDTQDESSSLLEQGKDLVQKAKDDKCFTYNPFVSRVYAAEDEQKTGAACPILFRAPWKVIISSAGAGVMTHYLVAYYNYVHNYLPFLPDVGPTPLPPYERLASIPTSELFCEYGACSAGCGSNMECGTGGVCCEYKKGGVSACSALGYIRVDGNNLTTDDLDGIYPNEKVTSMVKKFEGLSGTIPAQLDATQYPQYPSLFTCSGGCSQDKGCTSLAEACPKAGLVDFVGLMAFECQSDGSWKPYTTEQTLGAMDSFQCEEDGRTISDETTGKKIYSCGGNETCLGGYPVSCRLTSSVFNCSVNQKTVFGGLNCLQTGLSCTPNTVLPLTKQYPCLQQCDAYGTDTQYVDPFQCAPSPLAYRDRACISGNVYEIRNDREDSHAGVYDPKKIESCSNGCTDGFCNATLFSTCSEGQIAGGGDACPLTCENGRFIRAPWCGKIDVLGYNNESKYRGYAALSQLPPHLFAGLDRMPFAIHWQEEVNEPGVWGVQLDAEETGLPFHSMYSGTHDLEKSGQYTIIHEFFHAWATQLGRKTMTFNEFNTVRREFEDLGYSGEALEYLPYWMAPLDYMELIDCKVGRSCWEDWAYAATDYVLEPCSLKAASEDQYNYMKNKVFKGQEYLPKECATDDGKG